MHNSSEVNSSSAHHFGNLLVKRERTFSDVRWMFYAAAVVVFSVGVVLIVNGFDDSEDLIETMPALSFFAACGAVLFGLYQWISLYTQLLCYELGVVRVTLFGSRELPFADLDAMAFSKRRQYTHHGLYVGTTYFLLLQPLPATRSSLLSFNTQVYQGVEAEMEAMRDHIADLLAESMAAELQLKGSVFWTPFMRIVNEGVQCEVNRQWQLVPWEHLRLEVEADDWLKVYDERFPPPLVRVGQICANFYPGLLLVTGKLAELERNSES